MRAPDKDCRKIVSRAPPPRLPDREAEEGMEWTRRRGNRGGGALAGVPLVARWMMIGLLFGLCVPPCRTQNATNSTSVTPSSTPVAVAAAPSPSPLLSTTPAPSSGLTVIDPRLVMAVCVVVGFVVVAAIVMAISFYTQCCKTCSFNRVPNVTIGKSTFPLF
mmetsp:Transcript_63310/g.152170  ORF Transcript_63310/g.152170 Transcript_63310/m.152170 type:complete len:162 (-) Transcript_63310:233-718(-)